MNCNICGKESNKLIGGICNECINKESMQKSKEFGDEPVRFVGESSISLSGLMDIAKDMHEQAKSVMHTLNSSENLLNRKITMLMINLGIDKTQFRAYYNIVKELYDDYEIEIDSGEYKLVLLENYGVKGGGTVVEKRMGIAVYKETEYYDEDEVVEDEYDEDTNEEIEDLTNEELAELEETNI